jgi:restriction system protein
MAIPDYQSCLLPFLRFLQDGQEHSLREAEDAIALQFGLSAEERAEMLPSGQQGIFRNRVGWARTYLKKACLLDSSRRGVFQITDRGREVLESNPPRIDAKYLERFPEFLVFRDAGRLEVAPSQNTPQAPGATPEERIEAAYSELRAQLEEDLLAKVLTCSPSFFEQLVVDLLVAMGYGGSRRDAGTRLGQSGDGGVDGVIKEDRLGLDAIFVQAKRWKDSVGRPEIQKFVGALQGQRARKGVFITTSSYSQEAKDYAARIDTKVVLIDGKQLAGLMIDHDVGVSAAAAFTVKKVDLDYFEDA